MKRLIKYITLLFFVTSVYSQDTNVIIHLKQELKTELSDTARVRVLINLSKEYKLVDTTQAVKYLQQLYSLTSIQNDANGMGNYYEILGEMRSYYCQYKNAIQLYNHAISQYLLAGEEVRRADVIVDQGNAHLFLAEYDIALKQYQKALKIFKKNNCITGMSRCLNNIGIIYKNFGEYNEALKYYDQTKVLYEQIGDSLSIAEADINIGNVYVHLGAYHNALSNFNSALQIAKQTNSKGKIAIALLNSGVVHNKMSNYYQALKYYKECLALSIEIDNKVEQSKCLTNIGTNYISMGKYDMAEHYLAQGMALKQELGEVRSISNCYTYMADIRYHKEDYQASIELDKKAIALKIELSDYEGMARVYNSLSRTALAIDKSKEAIRYADSALYYAMQIGTLENLTIGYQNKKEGLAQLGRYKQAYEASVNYHLYSDSLFNDHKARAVNEIELKYQSKVLEEENELLKLQSDLDTELIKKQKKFVISVLGGFILFAVIIILLIIIQRRQRHYSRALQKKNIIITKQNIKLDSFNRTKDTILSVMTHDLRGTIGNQLTALSILSKEEFESEEERKLVFSRLANSARLSLGLLENLTLWTKIQEDSLNYDPEQGYINHTFNEVIALYKESITNKEIDFIVKMNDDIPCFFDQFMITNVLKNLLSNAIKFSNRGGHIEAGIEIVKSGVNIYITDQGIGIRNSEKTDLLKGKVSKMRRGTENEKGSGLGLNIVKNFLDKHSTFLTLNSEEEEGTSVSFILDKTRPI